jgi:hypothetical protein
LRVLSLSGFVATSFIAAQPASTTAAAATHATIPDLKVLCGINIGCSPVIEDLRSIPTFP